MASLQRAIEELDNRTNELFEAAQWEQKKFQNLGMQVKKKNDRKDWGTLLLFVKRRGKNTFEIFWHKKKWVKKFKPKPGESPWLLHSAHIKKGKSDHYPMHILLAGVKDWEKEEVPGFEDTFAGIRRELRAIMRSRLVLSGYIQAEQRRAAVLDETPAVVA